MRYDKRYSSICAIIVLSILLSLTFTQPAHAQEEPPRNATGFYHWFEIMQGDIPDTEQLEPDNVMIIHDTMFYVIPWYESRVYIHVPEGASVGYILDVHNIFRNATYGVSEYNNWYYWEFDGSAKRDLGGILASSNNTVLLNGVYDPGLLNITDHGVALKSGITYAEYTSLPLAFPDAVNITSATPVFQTDSDNATFMLSNDNGTTWRQAVNGTSISFPTNGTSLKYKTIISDDQISEASVSNISIEYSYMPASTTVALKAEYIILVDDDLPIFDIQKQFFYDVEEINILLYYEEGFKASSTNITWMEHFEIDPAMLDAFQKENKSFHIGSAEPGSIISLTVHEDIETSGPNYYLYSIVVVMAVIGLTGLYISRRNKGSADDEEDEEEDEEKEAKDGSEDPDGSKPDEKTPSTSKADLVTQKENILKAIKILDADLDNGNISQEVYDELKDNYKKEAIRLMKELDGQ